MPLSASVSLLLSDRVVFDDGEGGWDVVRGWVRSRGALIEATGRFDPQDRSAVADLPQNRDAELLDFGGRLISPAFVNAHTHLALGFLRGAAGLATASDNMVLQGFFRLEERLTPADVRAFARMGAYESLLHGVGWVWDHYYHGEEVAEALLEVGLGGVVAPTLQDVSGPGHNDSQRQLDATVRIAEATRFSERGVFAAVGPHATDTVSADLWGRAAETANRLDLPLHAHLAQSIEEVRLSHQLTASSPASWLLAEGLLESSPVNVLAHCLFVSQEELAQLEPARDHPVYCPYSQLLFGFPARPDRWEEHGLGWVVATDCSASNDSFNVQKELRFVAGQRTAGVSWSAAEDDFVGSGGLERAEKLWRLRGEAFTRLGPTAEPQRLLDRVWRVPGSLHPGARAGVLEPGALANVAVWDIDHPAFWPATNVLQGLAMGDTTQALHALFVAGREVGEAGDFHRSLVMSVAYVEAREEADHRLRDLLG